VYVYYTASGGASDVDDACGSDFVNRLARFTWNGDALVSPVTLADFPSFTSNHNGGPLAFGPDGMLYGVIGDGGRSGATQNDEDAAGLFEDTGVILRLDENGALPADNPFDTDGVQDDPEDAYFAYGIRNSFGLAFDPFTGALWDTENGPGDSDEINRIVPGANSGWIDVMGPASLTPGFDPDTDLVHLPGSTYVDPEYTIVDTVAPTGLAFASEATTLGAHAGNLFVADVNLGNVYELPLTAARDGLDLADRVADDQSELDGFLFASGFEGITDLEEGPDGDLYVVAIGLGEVWRISGAPGGGGAPVHDLAVAKVKAPKKISLSDKKPEVMKDLKLTLVNQGTVTETIDDLAALTNLVSIDWTSLPGPNVGLCDAPATEPVEPKKGFPLVLSPRKKLNVRFAVTWSCANDDAKSTRTDPHDDFELEVTLDHAALDGETDSDPSDDVCPRPPSGADKGCGAKGGGAIRTDVVDRRPPPP